MNLLSGLRWWLIKLIAGKRLVMLNAGVHAGTIKPLSKEQKGWIEGCEFYGAGINTSNA